MAFLLKNKPDKIYLSVLGAVISNMIINNVIIIALRKFSQQFKHCA